MSIRRILIANRGEIATRIIRTCRELRHRNRARGVGGGSRLDAGAARRPHDLHRPRPPGRQLSEGRGHRPGGARRPAQTQSIRATGFSPSAPPSPACASSTASSSSVPRRRRSKRSATSCSARSAAEGAGIPVVPGGAVDSVEAAVSMARLIGCPLLVKAVGGGGGRGMKRVERMAELPSAMALAASEAGAAFGDARVYLEGLVTRARHIEVQVLGDGEGRVIHLGERDCSVQRRYQKLIEESPAPELPEPLRRRLHDAAVRFAERLSYRGAGTVEFLVDGQRGILFPRDERADPGGAPGDRGRDRPGPRRPADRDCGRCRACG